MYMFNVLFEEHGYGPTHAILSGHVFPGGVGEEVAINTPHPFPEEGRASSSSSSSCAHTHPYLQMVLSLYPFPALQVVS